MRLTDLRYHFNTYLNDPVWLIDKMSQGWGKYEIAENIGCSPEYAERKIRKVHHGLNQIGLLHTGYFHYSKIFLVPVLRIALPKIQKGVDTVYDKIQTKNGKLFKKIILDMEYLDQDNQGSRMNEDRSISSWWFNIPRKVFYILILKFLVCLYEYDSYYQERADFMLRRIIDKRSEIFLDETSYPKNWYPVRDPELQAKHFIAARKE